MVTAQGFAAPAEEKVPSSKPDEALERTRDEDNLPKTGFEKRAAEAMRDGKPYYEDVVGKGDDRRLLAATIVPAVLEDCAKCHGAEQGGLLGFIRDDLPVQSWTKAVPHPASRGNGCPASRTESRMARPSTSPNWFVAP